MRNFGPGGGTTELASGGEKQTDMMKNYNLYICLALIFLFVAFAFNAYFLSKVKEGHRGGHGSGGHGSGGHGSRHGYSGDRGWVYGKGYYNAGYYWNNETISTNGSDSWWYSWYPYFFYWYPPQEEIIVLPYESVYYT